jgi:hypothetical protein
VTGEAAMTERQILQPWVDAALEETWQERSAQLYRRSTPWWKPDRRWQLHAATPVFAVFALGSLVLGVYKGFDGAPVIVSVAASVEFVVLAGVLIWHAREITTSFGDAAEVKPPGDDG